LGYKQHPVPLFSHLILCTLHRMRCHRGQRHTQVVVLCFGVRPFTSSEHEVTRYPESPKKALCGHAWVKVGVPVEPAEKWQ